MSNKCDILSARLGFEALVKRIRELESGVKDVSYNSRKRISTLERERDEAQAALHTREEEHGVILGQYRKNLQSAEGLLREMVGAIEREIQGASTEADEGDAAGDHDRRDVWCAVRGILKRCLPDEAKLRSHLGDGGGGDT